MQALLTDVHLLILDEPLSGLDPNSQQELEHILLIKTTRYIYTLHMSRKQLLENFADRIVTLANHTITENISAQKEQNKSILKQLFTKHFQR